MTSPRVGATRSPIRRSNGDFPHPDGPRRETNSPRWIVRSIPSRAVVTGWPPREKTLSTPLSRTTWPPPAVSRCSLVIRCATPRSMGSTGGGAGPAAQDDDLRRADDEKECDPEDRGDDDCRPELLRARGVVLVERS